MRIVLISSEFPPGPGGIGTHAYELARHLHDLGHEVSVLAVQAYASSAEVEAFNAAQPFGVTSLRQEGNPLQKGWTRYRQIRDALGAVAPDVVLGTGKRAVWLTAWAVAGTGIPWLAVGHGTEFMAPSPLDRQVSRWAYGQADGVVNVSRFTERQMRAMGIRPRRSWVIHNGADVERFRRLPKPEVDRYVADTLGLRGCRILATVGRVCERKGQHVVIQALPAVLRRVPDVHYVMAGLPEQQVSFEALARAKGVADHVHFLGRTEAEDVVRLLNASDLFVMTSTRTAGGDVEGFGIAVIEAALCGAPAVVTSGNGLTEAIVEGVTGLAVPEGDVDATARAITALLEDDRHRIAMGEAARQRAEEEQTWRHVAEQFEEVLAEVTGTVLREPRHDPRGVPA